MLSQISTSLDNARCSLHVVDPNTNSTESRPPDATRSWEDNPNNQSDSELPAAFGFRGGQRGPHASRTMMLAEIRDLLDAAPDDAPKAVYRGAIMDDNVLGKRTLATRRESYERLGWLYALDPAVAIFRALRFFWQRDQEGQPVLALLCASARDPLLRMTANTILNTPLKETFSNSAMEGAIRLGAPGRFNEATQVKIARNAAASWTHAGYLLGHRNKVRVRPTITPATVAYALALGYLAGASGQMLLATFWAQLLDTPSDQMTSLAAEASARGWIAYRQAGQVAAVAGSPGRVAKSVVCRLQPDGRTPPPGPRW